MPQIGRLAVEADQFYTADWAVDMCLKHVNVGDYDCVVEPSAGAGAFLSAIKHPNLVAIDIEPKADGVVRQNFFDFQIDPAFEKVLVVGNPPFGVHHKLADGFLQHAFFFPNVRTVAFILPNTYNKHTRQHVIPSWWRIKSVVPLDRNAFVYKGKPYHVPCSFFVLDKSPGPDLRFDASLYTEAVDFRFGDKNDFAFFIFGSNPGRVTHRPKPNNRGYFIKPKIDKNELIRRLAAVHWRGNSCASGGVAWFTKPEVVRQYNATYA